MNEILNQIRDYYLPLILNQIKYYLPFTEHWGSSDWIAAGSLIVAVVALLYARRSVSYDRKALRLQEQEIKRLKEEQRIKENKEKDVSESQRRQVPSNIFFGEEILFIPTMIEAGVPKDCRLGIFETKIKLGDYIKKGDEILTVTYEIFEYDEKPKKWYKRDKTFFYPIKLYSPVAGLIVGFREDYVGFTSNFTNSGRSIAYGDKEVFPVILLPKDESPQNFEEIKRFYNNIINTFNSTRRRILHSHAEFGYIRMGDSGKPQIIIEEFSLEKCELRKINLQDSSILRNIQHFRDNDLLLRDKLVHLKNIQ